MIGKRATKVSAVGLAVGAVLGVGLAAPASAAPVPYPVDIVSPRRVRVRPGHSRSSRASRTASRAGLPKGGASAHFTPWGGVYSGLKEFTCAGDGGGFTVRLNARFGEGGSTGSWTFVDGWGFLEGVKGSGTLVGIPTEDGLDDHYTGSAR